MLGFGALGHFTLGQPGENASAAGSVLATTISLVAGSATGTAAVNGATVAVAASLIAGAATADANAVGITISAAASLINGAATGAATASGAVVSVSSSATGGDVSVDAGATGAAITVSASIVAGTATGAAPVVSGTGAPLPRIIQRRDAEAPGDLLVATARLRSGRASSVSLFPGQAAGDADGGNIIRFVYAELAPGTAAGELNLHDDELMILLEAA